MSVSIITLFRYDIGIMALAAFSLSFFCIGMVEAYAQKLSYRRGFSLLFTYGLLVTLVMTLTIGALWLLGILEPALLDILAHNSSNYVAMRSLPFPSPWSVFGNPVQIAVVYLPFISVVFGVIVFCALAVNRKITGSQSQAALVMLVLVTACLIVKGLVRTSAIHSLLSAVPALLLGFLCFQIIVRGLEVVGLHAAAKTGLVLIYFLSVSAPIVGLWLAFNGANPGFYNFLSDRNTPQIPTLGRFVVEDNRAEAISYINDISFYFLTQRLPGTRWHQFDPGVQTSLRVQQDIVSELKVNQVKWIILDFKWDNVEEPNKSALSSGVTLLDDYIERHYVVVEHFGSIEVRRRRPE